MIFTNSKENITRKFLFFVFAGAIFVSGCSKENKSSSTEIKIEQQNPVQEKPREETKSAADTNKQVKQDSISQIQQTQKQENLFLKSKQAVKYIGKNATINGYVADVYKNEKVAYLNFDGKFPKNTFSGVIFKDDFSKFGDVNRFRNKNVEISGVISGYKGKPQVILKNTSQVKITN